MRRTDSDNNIGASANFALKSHRFFCVSVGKFEIFESEQTTMVIGRRLRSLKSHRGSKSHFGARVRWFGEHCQTARIFSNFPTGLLVFLNCLKSAGNIEFDRWHSGRYFSFSAHHAPGTFLLTINVGPV